MSSGSAAEADTAEEDSGAVMLMAMSADESDDLIEEYEEADIAEDVSSFSWFRITGIVLIILSLILASILLINRKK